MGWFSRTKSSQSTNNHYNTNYTYNTLDGGAIKSAFGFGERVSEEAFDSVDIATKSITDVAKGAVISSNRAVDAVGKISSEAFDSFDVLAQRSMSSLAVQNNHALTSLSALQSENARNNQKTLESMSGLVKSVQTQGATELIKANQTTTIVIVIALVIGVAVLWRSKK